MLCKGCGAEILNDQLYCPHCGTKNEQNQVPPNPIPTRITPSPVPSQVSPNPIPSQVSPNPIPSPVPQNPVPNRVPQNPMPSQVPQNPMPTQAPLNQMPPYTYVNQAPPIPQLPPNQLPPRQMPPNMAPNQAPPIPPLPPVPPYVYDAGRKKNKALVPIIIGVAALFLIIGIFVLVKIIGFVNDLQETASDEIADVFVDDTYVDDTFVDPYVEDSIVIPDDTSDDIITGDESDGIVDDTTSESILYSYYELPEVASIDSDSRFTYYNYNYGTDSITYTFLFIDATALESDFYTAVDDYCAILMNTYGYYYEEDFSYDQYYSTGAYTDYFSKDDMAIGVTASVEDTGWYAYVDIYDLTETTEDTSETTTDYSYPNYTYYIDGRETQYFEFGNEVLMENGVAFYLNSANVYDLADGTEQVECQMDLAASYADIYLYSDDFVVVPMDSEGNILADATPVYDVIDSDGNYLTMPYILDSEYYYTYTVTFIVPAETTALTFYGTNLYDGTISGPVYYFDMEVVE